MRGERWESSRGFGRGCLRSVLTAAEKSRKARQSRWCGVGADSTGGRKPVSGIGNPQRGSSSPETPSPNRPFGRGTVQPWMAFS